MTDRRLQPLCAECQLAIPQKKEWIICRDNCVHHEVTGACTRPKAFVRASHTTAPAAPDQAQKAVAKALIHQRKRLFHKLTTGKCLPDGNCADCILCDNAGGCDAEQSYQVQQARKDEREKAQRRIDAVIEELERRYKKNKNAHDAYYEGMNDGYDHAIALLQGGRK